MKESKISKLFKPASSVESILNRKKGDYGKKDNNRET